MPVCCALNPMHAWALQNAERNLEQSIHSRLPDNARPPKHRCEGTPPGACANPCRCGHAGMHAWPKAVLHCSDRIDHAFDCSTHHVLHAWPMRQAAATLECLANAVPGTEHSSAPRLTAPSSGRQFQTPDRHSPSEHALVITCQPRSIHHGLCVGLLQDVTDAGADSSRFSWLVAAAAAAHAIGSVTDTEAGDSDQAADKRVSCSSAECLPHSR